MNHEKVALIFGGARGIGAAIAARLAHEGYRVAITWVSRPDRAQALVSTIEQRGGQAIAIEADSADPRAIQAAVDKTLRHYGRLDVAVVNAGVLRLGPIRWTIWIPPWPSTCVVSSLPFRRRLSRWRKGGV